MRAVRASLGNSVKDARAAIETKVAEKPKDVK
jgi:hypothetical protein